MNAQTVSYDTIVKIPIDKIQANPHQPRKIFDPEKLQELAESIKKYGLQQPITVTPRDDNGIYTLIAGERRVRAARQIELLELPAIITSGDPAILALVENLQRVDITPLEEAAGFQALIDRGETHESIAQLVGKTRTYVTQKIRLLKLPNLIKLAMDVDYNGKGVLSEGAARQLMRLAIIDRIATKSNFIHGSYLADFSDKIINSPRRLRGVGEIKREVDDFLTCVFLAGKLIQEKTADEIKSEAIRIIDDGKKKAGEDNSPVSITPIDFATVKAHCIHPDLSKLTDSQLHDLTEIAYNSLSRWLSPIEVYE